MNVARKFYLFGFVIYLFSFFLPAIFVTGTPYYGYECAYVAFGLLFDPIEVIDDYLLIAANLANVCTLLVFFLHFKVTLGRLLPLQFIAFTGAACLAVASLIQERELGPLLIGYWNWLFGISNDHNIISADADFIGFDQLTFFVSDDDSSSRDYIVTINVVESIP